MGFLSDKEIADRISSKDNLINRLEIHQIKGSREGKSETPIEIQKVAAILSNQGESCRNLERGLGVCRESINDFSKAESKHSLELERVIKDVKDQNDLNRESAESKAIEVLLNSLNLLPDALAGTRKAKTLSSVAKDMAAIANQMGNKDTDGEGNVKTMHLHLYAPKMKETKDYEVIDV